MKKEKINILIRLLRRRVRLKHEREERYFESSSIGDLAFLLLIFFIVTSSFLLRQGIFFSLPADNSSSVKLEEHLLLNVYPENNGYRHNDQLLTEQEFKNTLEKKQQENNNQSALIIFMKPEVKYSRLVDTLSMAKETGITRVSLKDL